MEMLKRLFFIILIMIPVFCFAQKNEIPFAIGEWVPYTGEKLPEYGIVTEIVSAACKEAGIKPFFRFYPWRRAEQLVKDGESFATFPYKITTERSAEFYFSEPLFESVTSIIKYDDNDRTKNFHYNQINDLKDYITGFTVGDWHESLFKTNGFRYEATETIDQSVKKLETGRIDLIVEDRIITYDSIRRLYPDKIDKFIFDKTNFREKIYYRIMVSKKYPRSRELLEQFNEGLKIISDKGILRKINVKYGIER